MFAPSLQCFNHYPRPSHFQTVQASQIYPFESGFHLASSQECSFHRSAPVRARPAHHPTRCNACQFLKSPEGPPSGLQELSFMNWNTLLYIAAKDVAVSSQLLFFLDSLSLPRLQTWLMIFRREAQLLSVQTPPNLHRPVACHLCQYQCYSNQIFIISKLFFRSF